MSACPRCGKETEPVVPICPGCGVILAKARPRPQDGGRRDGTSKILGRSGGGPAPMSARAQDSGPSADDARTPAWAAAVKVFLAFGAAMAAFFVIGRMQAKPIAPSPAAAQVMPANMSLPGLPALPLRGDTSTGPVPAEDWAFLSALSGRLQSPQAPSPSDDEMGRVEEIFDRSENNREIRAFLTGLYFRNAERAFEAGSFGALHQVLERLKELDDAQPLVFKLEAHAAFRQGNWAATEAAARKYDQLAGEDLSVSLTLAASLSNLDRRPEALAVLARQVFSSCATASSGSDVAACQAAQQLKTALSAPGENVPELARAREVLKVDASKNQIQSGRFDIRFDGESQSGVARDVLFVLDRAYVRLADIYYDRPNRKIPVVLHSSQDYQSATGAPWWSGGQYSSHNGAIQIPIRGMPSNLPQEMEDVLVHELSHAFVDEISGNQAGRDLQEGLAQYLEGKRIEEELGPAELRRLANSGRQTVMSFYMLSLAVTQSLLQSRGQGSINQLLKAMKETGSEDGGFRKVFGQSSEDMKKEILETFWRRYS